MTNESTTNRPACPFCEQVPDEFAKVAGYMRMYGANCCDRSYFVMLNENLEYSWAAHCNLYLDLPRAMHEVSKPQPVMIPVMPRFDDDGKPTCRGCPLEYDAGTDVSGYDYRCRVGWESYAYYISRTPGPDCSIHNPEAREGMEAL